MESNDKYKFQNYILVEAMAKTLYNQLHKESSDLYPEATFDDLTDDMKDHYRILARYMASRVEKFVDVLAFYANENNWTTPIENNSGDLIRLKDGVIFNDAGQKAREYLKELGFIK